MNWVSLVIVAIIATSLNIFIDNYISDFYFKGKGANAQKMFYAIASIVVSIVFLFAGGFDFVSLEFKTLILFFVSGFIASFGSIAYYKALEIDNSTNLSIFIQLTPVLYLIFGWILFGDSLSVQQLIAFLIILSAPFIIVVSTRKRSRDTQIKSILFVLTYVLIKVISNLIFIKENVPEINFISEIAFVYMGKGIGDLIIMYTHPKWRKRFRYVEKASRKKVLYPLLAETVVSVVKNVSYQASLILAPTAAIASASTDSIIPIAVFFMGLVFTIIWPKFGREKLNRKSVLVHLIATILVVIGIVLIQN